MPNSKTRILIVEDEAIVAADLENKLNRLGYHVVGSSAHGAEAVDLTGYHLPDVILMDIRLAGPMDGIEAAEIIRSKHGLPVIFLTAHSDQTTLERARLTEPFGYILKPYDERELRTSIEMARYRYLLNRQLRESREDLNRAQAVAHTGSWRLDVRKNELKWSDENWRIFGVTPGTPLTYEIFLSTVHPEDRETVHEKWSAALRGEPYDIEHRIIVGNEVKWVRERAEMEFDTQGELLGGFGTTQDITEMKAMQRREREDSIRLAWGQSAMDTINAMQEGVALLELDGIIVTVNPAVEKLTGLASGTIIGQNLETLLPFFLSGNSLKRARTGLAQLRRGEIPAVPPLFMTRPDGKYFHVLPSVSLMVAPEGGRRVAVLTLRDLTDMHEATQRLERSERKYRELVENANSIIMRITPEQTITFFNEYAQTFFGFDAGEVVGRNVVGTIAREVDSEGRDLRALLRDVSEHPETHGSNENENVCKDGRRVWVHWANRAIRDDQGNVVEILCVGTDITRRREMEAEALRYQQRLRELTERLVVTEEEERWRISRYIHDTIIQNLALSCIRLGTMEKPLVAARQNEEADKLHQVGKLLEEAIEECRMVMSDLTPALLYELGLGPALKDLAQQQGEKHHLTITVEVDGLPELENPLRGLLFMSAREFVMNALKHAGPCAIHVTAGVRGTDVVIQVEDNGRGFDSTVAPAHPDRHGGFGLFSIRQRLEGLGGHLDIRSTPGQGATATIRVPMVDRS
jgi:PAS domain S-box-containing protein